MSIWISRRPVAAVGFLAAILGCSLLAQERPKDQGFTFKSAVDLVTVNATVTTITLAPTNPTVKQLHTQQFTGTAFDQFLQSLSFK